MPARACPVGIDLLLGLCGAWAHAGATRIALVICSAYHLLLRTGEIFGLRAGNLHVGKDGVRVVGLGQTKTSQRDGHEAAIAVLDDAVAAVVEFLGRGLAAGDRLLPLSQGAWRRSLTQLLVALQIDDLHIRGYSVRRRGATFLFRTDGRFDVVMERGRWTSLTTTRT